MSPDHRTLLASVTSESLCWTGNQNRAETLLKAFFFDKDEHIREHAAGAFRNIPRTDVEKYLELTAVFLKSPALSGNSYAVLDMLKNATCEVLDLVITVSERLIRDTDQDRRRATDTYHLESIVKQEYTSSESYPEARKKILDLIDLMMSNEIYGVDSIVAAHDRW